MLADFLRFKMKLLAGANILGGRIWYKNKKYFFENFIIFVIFRVTGETGITDHSIIPVEHFATSEEDLVYKIQIDLEAYYID